MKFIFVILAVLLIGACSIPQGTTYDLVISNVGLFDGNRDRGVVNIGIRDNSVALISINAITHPTKEKIDGRGKYLVPGLINSHVHLTSPDSLKSALQSGIFAVVDLHKTSEQTAALLRTFRDSSGYASFYSSGFAATLPGGHPTKYGNFETINDSVTPTQFVENRVNNGADFIKLIRDAGGDPPEFKVLPTLNDEQIQEIITAAHQHHKLCIAHTVNLDESMRIATYGIDGFAHLWFKNEFTTDEQLQVLKKEEVFIIPTALTQERIWSFVEDGPPPMKEYAAQHLSSMSSVQKEILRLHQAGIRILAGDDPPNFGINQSHDLFLELDIYSKAGLTNAAVLQTATGNPNRVFDLKSIGVIEEGKAANFVLVEGNPMNDLSTLRKIERIWKNGERIK